MSHDRAFLDAVVTSLLVFEGGGTISEVNGGYSDWQRWPARGAAVPAAALSAPAKADGPKGERRELEVLPEQIEQLEAEQVRCAARLQDVELYRTDPGALPAIEAECTAIEAKIRAAYARWEELEAKRCALEEKVSN